MLGVGKLGQNIYERNLLRQTISFINELNRKEISQVKLDKYRHKLDSNSDFAETELGRVIITLNSNAFCWTVANYELFTRPQCQAL